VNILQINEISLTHTGIFFMMIYQFNRQFNVRLNHFDNNHLFISIDKLFYLVANLVYC
jgi:hypothetical protein